MAHIIYIALGSNLGERLNNLQMAITSMPPQINVLAESNIYETPPWGIEDQPAFLNMVLKAETELEPITLLQHLKQLEVNLGRQESIRWGPRLIDLDILFYDEIVLDLPMLVIPHPRLHERSFVLVPLVDIAPKLEHPVLRKSMLELLSQLEIEGIQKYQS